MKGKKECEVGEVERRRKGRECERGEAEGKGGMRREEGKRKKEKNKQEQGKGRKGRNERERKEKKKGEKQTGAVTSVNFLKSFNSFLERGGHFSRMGFSSSGGTQLTVECKLPFLGKRSLR